MTELDDALEQSPTDFANFSIESLNAAQWALRKLGSAQKKIDEALALASDEHARIAAWAEHATQQARDDVTFYENALKAYMLRVREESGEKSLDLPNGTITSRSIPAKAEVSDVDVFLKWATDNGHAEFTRTKVTPDLSALKGAVTFDGDLVILSETGEVVDGLLAIEEDVSVKVVVSQ